MTHPHTNEKARPGTVWYRALLCKFSAYSSTTRMVLMTWGVRGLSA